MAKVCPAPGWHAPQVWERLAALTVERESLDGKILWRIVCRQDLVRGPVTCSAGRAAQTFLGGCRAMHAGEELLDLLAVASRALLRHHAGSGLRIVRRAMTAHACIGTERSVHALGHVRRSIHVACRAFHSCNALRMGKFLDVRVASRAVQNGVAAGFMFCRIDIDTPPGVRFQVFIVVANEAIRVGIGGHVLRERRGYQEQSECRRRIDL